MLDSFRTSTLRVLQSLTSETAVYVSRLSFVLRNGHRLDFRERARVLLPRRAEDNCAKRSLSSVADWSPQAENAVFDVSSSNRDQ